ncbi:hypothetical protein HID58_049630 [Brassica napus]|uniref:Uncharacterized protein n=1 Tax=Brassica napus TaxID=3708 RepID=A0ABQ8B5J4_BRANA|nr:hypothetical protein HID58_049630 [Brassica napus]
MRDREREGRRYFSVGARHGGDGGEQQRRHSSSANNNNKKKKKKIYSFDQHAKVPYSGTDDHSLSSSRFRPVPLSTRPARPVILRAYQMEAQSRPAASLYGPGPRSRSLITALSKLWWSLPLEGRCGRKRSGCGGPVVWSVVIRFPGDRGLHRSVDASFISEGWRLRQLRRQRSSFRDVKESLTSVYSLRVEEGKASMIAVLLVGSSACFEFRRS